jgi:hypothetical protein
LNKIYRNGKHQNDSTKKILATNLGVIGMSVAMGIIMTVYAMHSALDAIENMILVTIVINAFFYSIGIAVYLYLTFIRIKPLAEFENDALIVNASIFSKRKICLSKLESIRLQYASEFDQRMRVKYKGEAHFEFIIKQTHCSVATVCLYQSGLRCKSHIFLMMIMRC